MRSVLSKLFLVAMLLSLPGVAAADEQVLPFDPAAKLLVERVGNSKASGAAKAFQPETITGFNNDFRITSGASREYVTKDGTRNVLTAVTADADAGAYALLTTARRLYERSQGVKPSEVGTVSFETAGRIFFVKGRVLVVVERVDGKPGDLQLLTEIAKTFSETLNNGEGDIPVLVKHLPDWQNAQSRVLYAVSQNALKSAFSNQSVLDVVSFAGGAEAVIADYQGPQLVIIEFNTPQIASDNDQRITAKIQEVSNQGTRQCPQRIAAWEITRCLFLTHPAPKRQTNSSIRSNTSKWFSGWEETRICTMKLRANSAKLRWEFSSRWLKLRAW